MGDASLSLRERDVLAECERVIERAQSSFIEAGRALARVRDERLYRLEFTTFEAYCEKRWGLAKSHVYRQIEAAKVAELLSPVGDKTRGLSERAVRPLTSVPKEHQREVFEEAQKIAAKRGKETPTARDTEKAAEMFRAPKTEGRALVENARDGMSVLRSLREADRLIKESKIAVCECVAAIREVKPVGVRADWLFQHGRELQSALRDLVTLLQEGD